MRRFFAELAQLPRFAPSSLPLIDALLLAHVVEPLGRRRAAGCAVGHRTGYPVRVVDGWLHRVLIRAMARADWC